MQGGLHGFYFNVLHKDKRTGDERRRDLNQPSNRSIALITSKYHKKNPTPSFFNKQNTNRLNEVN